MVSAHILRLEMTFETEKDQATERFHKIIEKVNAFLATEMHETKARMVADAAICVIAKR